MILLLLSFIAGALTILAPCVLPLLPVIVGSSISGDKESSNFKKALTIAISLGISLILFTFLLKVSTAFINIPPIVWSYISGTIIIAFGLVSLFPKVWEKISQNFSLMSSVNKGSNKMLAEGYKKKSFWGDVIIGAALGPVFSTCSPTYFVILATVLPQSFYLGFIDILAYAIGLSGMLLIVAFLGQKIVGSLGSLSNNDGWFKRGIGAFFIIIGVFIFLGFDKVVEAKLLSSGIFDVTKVEEFLLKKSQDGSGEGAKNGDVFGVGGDYADSQKNILDANAGSSTGNTNVQSGGNGVQNSTTTPQVKLTAEQRVAAKAKLYPKAPEIVNPSGFINTNNQLITIAQFKGKKAVLVDFWTYSCINCQRTTPYLNAWYQKYKDQGLEIVSIHTPEFSFEKLKANVEAAAKKEGIQYPIVQDNDYSTWTAFKNTYWPRKYLIDIDGYIVYDSIGEGAYDITERAIQRALKERNEVVGSGINVSGGIVNPSEVVVQTSGKISPETYFGFSRNEYLANGAKNSDKTQTLMADTTMAAANPNKLYLSGTWDFRSEYAEASSNTNTTMPAKIIYNYTAQNVYFVASGGNNGGTNANIKIKIDGQDISSDKGKDIGSGSTLNIKESRMYHLISHSEKQTHTIEIELVNGTLDAFTFTFG